MMPQEALVSVWRTWSKADDFPFSPDHCINGTRVAVEVLRHFGVRAGPQSVSVVVFNAFAWELYQAGVPVDEWPKHAHSVGVDPSRAEHRPGQWDGHLIARGEEFTLDISAGQFHRPGRIEMPGPVLIDGTVDERGLLAHGPSGLRMLYAMAPEANEWRTAGGWRLERNAAVVRHVIYLVSTVLAASEAERN